MNAATETHSHPFVDADDMTRTDMAELRAVLEFERARLNVAIADWGAQRPWARISIWCEIERRVGRLQRRIEAVVRMRPDLGPA